MTTGRNILFDLDGTLVDSLPGIMTSACVAIERVMPGVPVPDLSTVIGPPIAVMFRRLWPTLNEADLAKLVAAFRAHYDDEGCLLSAPYPDVATVLGQLVSKGHRLFVVTNKPTAPARRLLAHNGLFDHFVFIAGPDFEDPPFSNKPDLARHLAARFGLVPEATFLVGDGHDDAAASEACGFAFIAARYGYGQPTGPALASLSHFAELEDLLN